MAAGNYQASYQQLLLKRREVAERRAQKDLELEAKAIKFAEKLEVKAIWNVQARFEAEDKLQEATAAEEIEQLNEKQRSELRKLMKKQEVQQTTLRTELETERKKSRASASGKPKNAEMKIMSDGHKEQRLKVAIDIVQSRLKNQRLAEDDLLKEELFRAFERDAVATSASASNNGVLPPHLNFRAAPAR